MENTLYPLLLLLVLGLQSPPAFGGGHSNTILPMHFAGFGGIGMPMGPVGPPPIGLIANQVAAMRATNIRAGQLANLLERSNEGSFLTPVVRSLAANLVQKLTAKKGVAISAPQTKTTTVVTQEHRPLLHLDAHSQTIPHVHLNEASHVHLGSKPHFDILDIATLPGLTANVLGKSSLTNIILPQPQNLYHVDYLQPQSIFQSQFVQPLMQPIYQPIVQPQIIHRPHYIDRPVVREVIKEVVKPVIKEVMKQPTVVQQIIPQPPVQQITKQYILPQPQITRQVPIQQQITRQVPVQQVQQIQQRITPHQQKKIWSVKGGK